MPNTQVCMFCRYRNTPGRELGVEPACTHGAAAPARPDSARASGRAPALPMPGPRRARPALHPRS